MPQVDELRGLKYWGNVFEGDAPCGEDLSLDPDFELLTAEIAKDKSIHANQKTDWVVVYELSDSLLTRNKDLWAFCSGIVAIYYTKTVTECVTSVNSLAGISSTHWQSLYPSLKRPKRRRAPLKWMCDKFRAIAENTAFLNHSPKELGELNAAFRNLQDIVDALQPDNDLTFTSIIRNQIDECLSEEFPTHQAAANSRYSQKGKESNQTPQSMRSSLEEVEKSSIIPSTALPHVIRTINDNARQLGDHLLAISIEDERAFQLHRVATWTTLLQLPIEQNGMTELTCPIPQDLIDMYTMGVNDKRFSEMLPQIERSASKAPFWFDGHYLIVKCLEGMAAILPASSVKHSFCQLISRFPDLLTMKFKDGRPFASPRTVTWIDSFLPAMTGNLPYAVGEKNLTRDAVLVDETKLLQDAIALLQDKNFKTGLDRLGSVPPGKNRAFLRHSLVKARYCSAAGQTNAALQLLRSVLGKLKDWDLLEWEPELTGEVVSLLLSLSPKPKKDEQEELQLLLHTYCLETAIAAKK